MSKFFKKDKRRSLDFSYIEERKQRRNYTSWIVGTAVLIAAIFIFFFLLK